MKFNRLIHLIYLIAILTSFGCEDIIEKDISDERVALVAPADGLFTNVQTHSFSWEDLDDVSSYRLKIVEPDFESVAFFILDSLVQGKHFDYTLNQGDFQWTVEGENNGFNSIGDTFNLTIDLDTSSNLSNQILLVNSPASDLCFNNSLVDITLSPLTNAETYVLQIASDVDFLNIIDQTEFIESTFSYDFVDDGGYYFRIRAENNSSQTFTNWVSLFLSIDTTPPTVANLFFPVDGDTILIENQVIDLTWNSDPTAVMDSVVIFSDFANDSILYSIKTDFFGIILDTILIDDNPLLFDDYYWKIISIDKANNFSESDVQSFFVL